MSAYRQITKEGINKLFKQLGEYKKRADFYNFRCPFHQGSRFNFGISVSSGRFKCLGCPEEGSLADLSDRLSGVSGASGGWGEGLLAPGGGSEWDGDTSSAAGRARKTTPRVWDRQAWWEKQFTRIVSPGNSLTQTAAYDYLRRRHVNLQKYPVGLLSPFHTRVTFPFYEDGQVVYYQARSFNAVSALKTLNPDSKDWKGKGEVLWNYDNLRDTVIICEGIFDAIAAETGSRSEDFGPFRATCLLGKTITEDQIFLLRKKKVRHIFVMLDADAVPDAWELGVKLYNAHFTVHVCEYKLAGVRKKDPGECDAVEIAKLLNFARSVSYLTVLPPRTVSSQSL